MDATITPPKDDPWGVVNMIGQSAPVDCSKPYDTSTLAGKTILITGGASGFGAAFARHWARYGAHLIIGDVNDQAGEALIAELRSSSSTGSTPNQVFVYQHCDVTSWTDQLALFKTAISASPTRSLQAVVAGAGIVENSTGPAGSVFDEPRDFDAADPAQPPPPPPLRVLAVNLTGVMYTTHLALHYLSRKSTPSSSSSQSQKDHDRHILLISSIAGLSPLPGQTEYTTSKHAVMGLFRSIRGTAWSRNGVRVNALTPYFVETPIIPAAGKLLLAGAAKADLEDVVDAATRLMADEGVKGRALCIGPKMGVVDEGVEGEAGQGHTGKEWGWGGPGVRVVEGTGVEGERKQAVWEVYGHDYERVESWVWRFLAIVNVMREVNGWTGFVKDMLGICFGRRG
ncbi:uncharacterized protein C8A04DRAFT_16185 [Dichotomopilus funicola]|uniref:NAD(P)-binding protein n=1 Tax=Dichotomopilus funicola TaxID=1934379 RepID=A0AAN6ZHX5_9PEZI|nr:hypothetical protein C8A04DRAFT_16185 [Dichotomopilus funicola]